VPSKAIFNISRLAAIIFSADLAAQYVDKVHGLKIEKGADSVETAPCRGGRIRTYDLPAEKAGRDHPLESNHL